MSENSPRWPSASGASGLDFSPHRAPSDAPAPVSPAVPVINGDGPTHASSAPSSGTPASPSSGPSFSPAPVNAPSEPASAAPQAEAADQTRTIPAVAGRAAKCRPGVGGEGEGRGDARSSPSTASGRAACDARWGPLAR